MPNVCRRPWTLRTVRAVLALLVALSAAAALWLGPSAAAGARRPARVLQPARGRPSPPPSGTALGVPVQPFDPSGRALSAWRAATARAGANGGQARVLFYGASHTAADLWTGELRRLWQARWGEAGHGFVLPAAWNAGYRQQDLVVTATKGWTILRHRREDGAAVGDYGLLGVAMESADPSEVATVRTTVEAALGRRFDVLEVWPRLRAGGGDLIVEVDGKQHTVATREGSARFVALEIKDGPHVIHIHPAGNGVAGLYGIVAERRQPGVVLDQLGIPGMRSEIHLHWQAERWVEQAARRKPDLVVLAYGTNDLVAGSDPAGEPYVQQWLAVIARVRQAAPDASCLIVGPTDRLVGTGRGTKASAPQTGAVVAAQRKVAALSGCAHWDAFAAMGGQDAMLQWQASKLAVGDGVHLNRAGYVRLAHLFDQALHAAPRP